MLPLTASRSQSRFALATEVTLHTLGVEFSSFVFFAQDPAFTRNFLGRSGWLTRVRIGTVHYEGTLLLSAYEW